MNTKIKVFSILAFGLHLSKNLTRRNDTDFNLVGDEMLSVSRKATEAYPYGKITQKDIKKLNPVVTYAIDFSNAQRVEVQDIIQLSLFLTSIDDLLCHIRHKRFREHLLDLEDLGMWALYLVDPDLNHDGEYDKAVSFYHNWTTAKTYK